MRRILILAGRDFRSYFLSPGGYVIIALFMLLTGLAFWAAFQPGKPASLSPVFNLGTWMLLIICPAISMGAISDERRQGTFETLMTSPVNETQVILAKFLAALAFLTLILLPTGLHVVALELYGRPDYGEIACGYLGMLLAGAAYLASGILASTLTTAQVIAFLLSFLLWLAVMLGASFGATQLPDPFAGAVFAANPQLRLSDFAIGLLDSANVVYFVSLTAVFLIAAVRALEARRWR